MENGQVFPLTIGLLGLSDAAIDSGKQGWCYFPVGKPDPAYAGGRQWIRVKVRATEAVRTQRDVLVATSSLEVKEHTPVELSYQSDAGPYQRVTEQSPLTVTLASRDDVLWASAELTAIGDTAIVTPTPSKKVKVVYIGYSNSDTADATVSLKFESGGTERHKTYLVLGGGNWNAILAAGAPFVGAADQVLYGVLAAAVAANPVYVTIGYVEE